MDLSGILDDCLDRIQAGASAGDCLASYPEHAAELAPLLGAAGRLTVLRRLSVPAPERAAAKSVLREALSAAKARGARGDKQRWFMVLRWQRPGWALASGVAVLIIAGSVWLASTAAASGPGDWSYGVRLTAERLPASLQFGPEPRAAAEMAISERRLEELKVYVQRAGKVDARAVDAVLAGDEAAGQAASGLPPEARVRTAARLEEHARSLKALAGEVPPGPAAEALEQAATRVERLSREFNGQSTPLPLPPPATDRPADDQHQDRPVHGQLPKATRAAGDVTLVEPDGPGEKRGHERPVPGKAVGHTQDPAAASTSHELSEEITSAVEADAEDAQPVATGTARPAEAQPQPATNHGRGKDTDDTPEAPGERGRGHEPGGPPGQGHRGSPSPPGQRH